MVTVLAFGLALWPVEIVTVTLPKHNSHLISASRVGPDDLVRFRYRHSVELTAVEGLFQVGPESKLLAVETRMESVGTGLPNAYPERTIKRNGYMVVDEKRRPVGSIRFFLAPINEVQLAVANHAVDTDNLEPGVLVEVAAKKIHLIRWILWKVTRFEFVI
jgi:hypothetical protein